MRPCLKPHAGWRLTIDSSCIAPTHIAFAADDRTQVRNCYTSALSAGGRPSGPPGYRNHECSCFNAAVEDLDGNTIEFIFRENGPCDAKPSHADEEKSRVLTWQEGVSKEADAASVASKAESKAPTEAPSEKAPSEKAPTVAEPEPAAEAAPASDKGILSALSSGITGKNVLGGVIGAVAVGAVGYAFYRSEQDSARAEAAHEALMASYERGRVPAYAPGMKRSMSAAAPRTARTYRNYAPTESIGPDPRQHRNFSVTESRVGPRPPPTQVPTQAPTAMKAIEARAYDRDSEIQSVLSRHTSRYPRTEYRALEAPGTYYDDDEIQTVLSKHTSRHPEEMRAIEAGSKAPTMVSKRTSHRALEARSEAPTMMSRRSSHAPQEPRALEGARSEAPTMASRRSSHAPQETRAIEDARSEAPTTLSKHTSRRSQALRALDMDSEVQAATSRMTSRRPQVTRSQTFDASVYSPMPSSVGSAGTLPTRAPPKRSATLTDDPTAHSRLYLEGPKELVPSSKSLRSGRDEYSEAGRSEGGVSKVSHRSSRRDVKDDDEVKSQASTVRHIKPDGSRYEGSRHEGARYEGSKHGSSKHEGSAHEAKHEGSEHGRSRHEGSRHEGSRHASSHNDGASRNGLSRDPDALSDASTIKASRRDSAAHIPSPASKAASKVSRATAAEYRLPDSPVPSYYYPPSEAPKPVAREPVQAPAMQVPAQAFRPASHQTVLQPAQAPAAVYAPPPAARRASHASGSAAGVPLPSSLASGRGYEDVDDSDGLGDIKTVVPDDSISCIDLSKPRAPRSDISRHSERSHRSHRTHHSSRSKHSHRHDDEKSRVAIDAQTVVPEDSISSVGSKPARSEHSHHTHRSSRDDNNSHHSSRSKHSKSHEKEEEKEADDATVYLDARTVLPEDSISSVGAPARSEHSHHSHRSSRDDKKSHHSSRSRHSKSHDEDKEKKHRKEGRTDSEAGRSDVTVKPAKAKSILSAMTLPGRLKGEKEEKKKRSVASYA